MLAPSSQESACSCLQCGDPIETLSSEYRGAGRKRQFCSSACKKRFERARKTDHKPNNATDQSNNATAAPLDRATDLDRSTDHKINNATADYDLDRSVFVEIQRA